MSQTKKDSIVKVLHSFVDAMEREDMEDVSQKFPEELLSEYREAFHEDKDMFSHFMKSRENGILMNVMDKEYLSNQELKMFYIHYDFIRNHVTAAIKMKEGNMCSADKAGFVMASLEKYLKSGEEKEPDYTQKYTFHLPKKVLNDTNTIYRFFKALIALYYGNSKDYFLMQNQFIVK